MRSVFFIKSRLLGFIAMLLVLAQSLFAAGISLHYAEAGKTEVKQERSSQVHYVEAVVRITLPPFYYYWISKTTAVDIPHLDYQTCIALFVNAHSFNVFYIFTTALAP